MADNDIKLNDLCNLLANEVGSSSTVSSARKYLSALQRVILRELELNGRIRFFNFGTFELYDIGGYDRKMGDMERGGITYRYIKPRTKVSFKPSSVLIKAINENDFKPIKQKTRKKMKKVEDLERTPTKKKAEKSMEELLMDLLNKKEGK